VGGGVMFMPPLNIAFVILIYNIHVNMRGGGSMKMTLPPHGHEREGGPAVVMSQRRA
jgi:hypothetical protein